MLSTPLNLYSFFFFFNDTATTEIYTLSLHDALPIWTDAGDYGTFVPTFDPNDAIPDAAAADRKSTRLNSSHSQISYAVFCLKKKKKINTIRTITNSASDTNCCDYSHLSLTSSCESVS